jgi:hypothetical protein
MTSNTSVDSLIVGQTYFLLSYLDRRLQLPEITTYVYVGKNMFEEDDAESDEIYYFQSAASFVGSGLFHKNGHRKPSGITAVRGDSLIMIYDWPGLVAELDRQLRAHKAG